MELSTNRRLSSSLPSKKRCWLSNLFSQKTDGDASIGEEEGDKSPKPPTTPRERPFTLPSRQNKTFCRRVSAAKKHVTRKKRFWKKRKFARALTWVVMMSSALAGWTTCQRWASALKVFFLPDLMPTHAVYGIMPNSEPQLAHAKKQQMLTSRLHRASKKGRVSVCYVCVLVRRPRAPRLTAFLHALPSTRTMWRRVLLTNQYTLSLSLARLFSFCCVWLCAHTVNCLLYTLYVYNKLGIINNVNERRAAARDTSSGSATCVAPCDLRAHFLNPSNLRSACLVAVVRCLLKWDAVALNLVTWVVKCANHGD